MTPDNKPGIVCNPPDLEWAADHWLGPQLLANSKGYARVFDRQDEQLRYSIAAGSILDVIVYARRYSNDRPNSYIEVIEDMEGDQDIDFPGPEEVQIPGYACVKVCLFP